jgi:branched-chain amino acid transport system substrate-binding protein
MHAGKIVGRHGLVGALSAALLLGLAAGAYADTTVKIGVILTYSGPQASPGDQVDKGLDLYVREHEKDLPQGIHVEIIKRDDTGPNPDVAKRLAQELITRDHVQFLCGVVWTPNAAAIAPLTAEAKVPFIDMNAAGVTLTRLSPYLARTSFTLWQSSYPLGQWVAKQGWKKGFTVASDYAPGHEAAEAFTKGFKEGGGEIVDAVTFPLANPDFVPFLQRVKDAKPDVLFAFIPAGKQATQLMKAYGDLGLDKEGIKLVGPQDIVTDEELPNMGDTPLGVITAGGYSSAADRPANKAFLAAWHAAYDDKAIPSFMSVSGWDGMALIFDTIKELKGDIDPDKAMAFISHWHNANSPRGPISIDPETRDIVQNEYIRKVEKVDGKIANVEFDTIPDVKDPWKIFNPVTK